MDKTVQKNMYGCVGLCMVRHFVSMPLCPKIPKNDQKCRVYMYPTSPKNATLHRLKIWACRMIVYRE